MQVRPQYNKVAAKDDPVQELVDGYRNEGYDWQPYELGGRASAHRAWVWTDPNGIGHMATCGSGGHKEHSAYADRDRLKERMRACMAGACTHRRPADSEGQPVTIGEAAELNEQERQFQPKPNDLVSYNGQNYYVEDVEGSLIAIIHAKTGEQDIVDINQLGPPVNEPEEPALEIDRATIPPEHLQ
jgi:hypothetical protein